MQGKERGSHVLLEEEMPGDKWSVVHVVELSVVCTALSASPHVVRPMAGSSPTQVFLEPGSNILCYSEESIHGAGYVAPSPRSALLEDSSIWPQYSTIIAFRPAR